MIQWMLAIWSLVPLPTLLYLIQFDTAMRNNRIKATFICAQNITATCQLCDLWELLSSSDLQFLTIRRNGEESDAAVKRPYMQPEMCKYVFYEPRTSFLSEKTSNRQIDTEVLILFRWPFLGILSVLKKKKRKKLQRKKNEPSPILVLILSGRQKGFLFPLN